MLREKLEVCMPFQITVVSGKLSFIMKVERATSLRRYGRRELWKTGDDCTCRYLFTWQTRDNINKAPTVFRGALAYSRALID